MNNTIFRRGLVLSIILFVFLFATATSVSATAGSNTLNPGEQLLRGQSLTSNNSQYTLILQDDGNLVLYGRGRALWYSGTYGLAVRTCIMQTDGNLVLYGYSNNPVWASNTWGNSQSRLVLQDDGNLVIYRYGAIWASNTWFSGMPNTDDPSNKETLYQNEQLLRGQSMRSDNGLFTLAQQDDGNLVLYGFGRALWYSGTNGLAVRTCIMQSDGNLVLYGYSNNPVWASNTWGHINPTFVLQNDGNAVIYADTGIWATGTN